MKGKRVIDLFGRYYEEPDRRLMDRLYLKRRPAAGVEGSRYLSRYLKDYHNVEVDPSLFEPPTIDYGAEPEVTPPSLKGLDKETDVELLRRKIVRLANSLSSAQGERDSLRVKVAKLEAALSGIDNVILSDLDDASDKEKKLELLKVVFEENKQLRKDLSGE